jgi:hypothetical protein
MYSEQQRTSQACFIFHIGFEVLTAAVMKRYIFWDITLCSPLKGSRRFEGRCRLYLQGRKICQVRNRREAGSKQSMFSDTSVNFYQSARRNIPENSVIIIIYFVKFNSLLQHYFENNIIKNVFHVNHHLISDDKPYVKSFYFH